MNEIFFVGCNRLFSDRLSSPAANYFAIKPDRRSPTTCYAKMILLPRPPPCPSLLYAVEQDGQGQQLLALYSVIGCVPQVGGGAFGMAIGSLHTTMLSHIAC